MRNIPENSQLAAPSHPRSGGPAHGGLVSRKQIMGIQTEGMIRIPVEL